MGKELRHPPNSAAMILSVRAVQSVGTDADVAPMIHYMRDNGSSITLHWGEDTGFWECSWITNGIRFVGISNHLHKAIAASIEKALVTLTGYNRRTEGGKG